jgi:hypothetical protein
MLQGMHRLVITLRDEELAQLRELALRDHRTVRDQAGWLLHLKLEEEYVKLEAPVEQVA